MFPDKRTQAETQDINDRNTETGHNVLRKCRDFRAQFWYILGAESSYMQIIANMVARRVSSSSWECILGNASSRPWPPRCSMVATKSARKLRLSLAGIVNPWYSSYGYAVRWMRD